MMLLCLVPFENLNTRNIVKYLLKKSFVWRGIPPFQAKLLRIALKVLFVNTDVSCVICEYKMLAVWIVNTRC